MEPTCWGMPLISCLVHKAYGWTVSIIFISINYCLPRTKATPELPSFYLGPQSGEDCKRKHFCVHRINISLVSYARSILTKISYWKNTNLPGTFDGPFSSIPISSPSPGNTSRFYTPRMFMVFNSTKGPHSYKANFVNCTLPALMPSAPVKIYH
jgi:hypothetical protein